VHVLATGANGFIGSAVVARLWPTAMPPSASAADRRLPRVSEARWDQPRYWPGLTAVHRGVDAIIRPMIEKPILPFWDLR